MKKKMIAWMLFSSLVLATLAGCSSNETSNGNAGSRSEVEKESLVVWTNMAVEAETIQKYATLWGDENGYEVEVIHQSPSVQKFAQAVQSPDGPDAVVGIPNDQLADYINADLAAEVPADLYSDSDFSDAAIQACYVDGVRYAAPLAVETIALFYNTEKVAEVPAMWEELIEIAKENGGVQFDATSIYYDLGFVRASGGYIFNYQNGAYDVTDIGLANEGAVQAYEFIYELYNTYNYVSADVTADIARSNFQNGETAFYIGGPWDIDGFESAGTPFAVVEMPTFNGNDFVTPVGTQVSFVSSDSDQQEAAWDFIMYLIDNGAMELYEVGERIPAKLADQENDVIKQSEISTAFINQINKGEPMPTVSEMGQLWTIHVNNIRSMWRGELTPQGAAENIVNQLEEAVELMNSGK